MDGIPLKDTEKGPLVWEVRAAPFWMKRDGKAVGPYWLVAARDRLDQDKIKYFLSNASAGVPLEVILHVGFSRWPVERTLEDEKSELGLSHFMVRKYPSVLRHLRITQVSHLFLARQTERLWGKKSGGDDLPGASSGPCPAGCVDAEPRGPQAAVGQGCRIHPGRSDAKRRGAHIAHQEAPGGAKGQGRPPRQTPLLHPAAARVAMWD